MKRKYVERPLRVYFKAKVGDELRIKRRKAIIIRIIPYQEVIEEMKNRGATEEKLMSSIKESDFISEIKENILSAK